MDNFYLDNIKNDIKFVDTNNSDTMISLLQLAKETESFNVLTAIKHVLAGYTEDTAGCVKDFLPFDYKVDVTEDQLSEHFKRVNQIRTERNKNLPTGIQLLNGMYKQFGF